MDELVDFMKDFIMNFLNFVGYAKCTYIYNNHVKVI